MKLARSINAALIMGVVVATLAACDMNKGPAEKAGEKLDDATEQAGEAIEEAGEKIQDATE